MNLEIISSSIIFDERLLKNQNFNSLFYNAVCLLFSFDIDTPRVLVNTKSKKVLNFLKKISKKCEICYIFKQNIQKFSTCTHFCEFDLGLYFSFKKGSVCVKFISGSGLLLSATKMSIIENEFSGYIEKIQSGKINEYNFCVKHPIDTSYLSKIKQKQIEKLKNFTSCVII